MNKKKLFPLALVPLAATSLQAQSNVQTERTDKRPNIILFMVDDMGWQDTSLPFYKEKSKWNFIYHTPNIEKLAGGESENKIMEDYPILEKEDIRACLLYAAKSLSLSEILEV